MIGDALLAKKHDRRCMKCTVGQVQTAICVSQSLQNRAHSSSDDTEQKHPHKLIAKSAFHTRNLDSRLHSSRIPLPTSTEYHDHELAGTSLGLCFN